MKNKQNQPVVDTEKYLELCKQHMEVMQKKNILISVYTNASGFLYSLMKVDSGTDLGWSDFNGDCPYSGTFTSFDKALEDALNLISLCDLERFRKECPNNRWHWGNYVSFVQEKYRKQ
jgi:hypothetical protein